MEPALDVSMSGEPYMFSVLDRKRYGLNLLASFPQLESSICTNCTGTTSIAPAGITTPDLSLKSSKYKEM